MMKQKVYPPNLGFWTLVLAYFQIMYVILKKNLVSWKRNKCWKKTKVVQKFAKTTMFSKFLLRKTICIVINKTQKYDSRGEHRAELYWNVTDYVRSNKSSKAKIKVHISQAYLGQVNK